MADTIAGRPELSKFTTALREVGLDKMLVGKKFTIFAPTDAAIEALPAGQWAALVESKNKAALATVLKGHISPGSYSSQRLVAAKAARYALPSLSKQPIRIDRRRALKAEDAALYRLDVTADNGTIHVMDKVFLADRRQAQRGVKR